MVVTAVRNHQNLFSFSQQSLFLYNAIATQNASHCIPHCVYDVQRRKRYFCRIRSPKNKPAAGKGCGKTGSGFFPLGRWSWGPQTSARKQKVLVGGERRRFITNHNHKFTVERIQKMYPSWIQNPKMYHLLIQKRYQGNRENVSPLIQK